MKYTKPALTVPEQVELLLSRGLIGDRAEMEQRLTFVNYYRLSGYAFPFRDQSDRFLPGTCFRNIWNCYVFDRKLRLLVLDAVERVEVAVRTRLSYELGHAFGPFGYMDNPAALAPFPHERERLLQTLRGELERNEKEQFLVHFRDKYGAEHAVPPIWVASEVFAFGSVVRLVEHAAPPVRANIARAHRVPDEVLISWLRTINFVRNVCAHHGRLWNRVLPYRVKIPRKNKYPAWHEPVAVPNDRLFVVLTVLQFLLKQVAPRSQWATRLDTLFGEYPNINRGAMGYPERWRECRVWRDDPLT